MRFLIASVCILFASALAGAKAQLEKLLKTVGFCGGICVCAICAHWIPTQYCPLSFEFSLQDGTNWCDTSTRTGGGGAVIPASTTYELWNMYLCYDIATLDSTSTSQFANMLKSGGAIHCVYESRLMTTITMLSPDFTTEYKEIQRKEDDCG